MNHKDLTMLHFKETVEKYDLKGKLLDAGARDSHLKAQMEGLGFEWFGCDICSGIELSENNEPTDVVKCDMQKYPYEKDTFDVIFSCHSFEHLENGAEALREAKRILKKGGYLYISMPMFGRKYIVDADKDHINVLHPLQMERLCDYVGVELVESYEQEMPNNNGEQNNQIYIVRMPGD